MIGAAMGLVSSPLRLKALIIGAVALAAVCLALITWALIERSGRLGCRVDVVRLEGKVTQLEGQVDVLADKIRTQNTAIDGWRLAAEKQKGVGDVARAAAAQTAAKIQPELDRLRDLVAKTATGAAQSCAAAAAEVRRGLRQ